MTKKLLALLACVCLTGCMPHFKDMDSYNTLFRNDEVTPSGKGDPYTFGGIAEGSGGAMARQSYATDNHPPDFRDATANGRLGEIARDRTPTPGGLPGVTGKLPGAGSASPTYPGFEDLPVGTPNTSLSEPPLATAPAH